MNMVMPAMQLAKKIPDMHVQLWGSALLRGKFMGAVFAHLEMISIVVTDNKYWW